MLVSYTFSHFIINNGYKLPDLYSSQADSLSGPCGPGKENSVQKEII